MKNLRLILLCSLFLGIGFFLARWLFPPPAAPVSPDGLPPAPPPAAATEPAQPPTSLTTLLQPRLGELLSTGHGDYDIYVQNLKNDDIYCNHSESRPSASMIKMYILAYAFQLVQDGQLDLQESLTLRPEDKVGGAGDIQGLPSGTRLSLRTLLEKMIEDSDNVATNMLIERLGRERIQNYIQAHGYRDTRLQREMMDLKAVEQGRDNYTSVQDLAQIFHQLYHHQCVSPELDEQMISILKAQTDNDKIPPGLGPEAQCAHKTGEVEGYLHDGGLIYNPKNDYLLVIMTREQAAPATVTGDMVQISQRVFQTIMETPPA